MSAGLVIHDAEVDGVRVDVAIDGERITAVVPAGAARAEHAVDAGGGALIPGLHDHHLHLLALAAAATSVACGPPGVTGHRALADQLGAADRTLASSAWLRGVGYHESVAGDLDRRTLDALVPTRPCRVQHRSGHGWILNTAALAAIGIAAGGELPEGVEIDAAGAPTGRIYGLDAWLGERLPRSEPDLAAVGRRLGAFGVTAVTDATPVTDPAALQPIVDAVRSGSLPQHVAVTGAATMSTDALDLVDGITLGPAKVMLADHQLPSLDDVVGAMRTAHERGRRVAVHCVTRAALALALAAWDDAGVRPGDRIEHGAVVPDEMAAHVAALGLTVVTQPGFVAERGDDYLADVDEDDRPVPVALCLADRRRHPGRVRHRRAVRRRRSVAGRGGRRRTAHAHRRDPRRRRTAPRSGRPRALPRAARRPRRRRPTGRRRRAGRPVPARRPARRGPRRAVVRARPVGAAPGDGAQPLRRSTRPHASAVGASMGSAVSASWAVR